MFKANYLVLLTIGLFVLACENKSEERNEVISSSQADTLKEKDSLSSTIKQDTVNLIFNFKRYSTRPVKGEVIPILSLFNFKDGDDWLIQMQNIILNEKEDTVVKRFYQNLPEYAELDDEKVMISLKKEFVGKYIGYVLSDRLPRKGLALALSIKLYKKNTNSIEYLGGGTLLDGTRIIFVTNGSVYFFEYSDSLNISQKRKKLLSYFKQFKPITQYDMYYER